MKTVPTFEEWKAKCEKEEINGSIAATLLLIISFLSVLLLN